MTANRREFAFLSIVFAGATISTVAWVLADRTPPAWDPADHLRTAYDFYRPLAHGQVLDFFHEFFRVPHPYAPLFHLITAGVFLVSGASRLAGIVANFFGLAVLLLSVNWMGNRLHKASEQTPSSISTGRLPVQCGAVAALLTVCYHFPAWMIHDAFLDYLLTAMVALAFALLLRADEFHVRSHAILFGVAAGLGMLVKQTFLFFFIIPAAYLWIRALLRRDRRAIANLLLSAAIVLGIASIWYVPHLNDILGIYRVNVMNAAAEHEAPVFSSRSFAYYWAVLADLQLQLPFSFLFIAGAVYSIRRRFRQDRMLYLWILSGILTFTMIANKDTRYTVPILPAVALLSVSWFGSIRRNFRWLATGAMVIWAFISFFNAQWPSEGPGIQMRVSGYPLYILAGNVFGFDHRPLPDDWSIPGIIRSASGHPSSRRTRLGVVPNIWQLNPSNVALYARLLAAGRGAPPLLDVYWLDGNVARSRLDQCDYVLARTDLQEAIRVSPTERELGIYLREHSDRFRPVATFALPDAQEAVLYERL